MAQQLRKWMTKGSRHVLSFWKEEDLVKQVIATHVSNDLDFDLDPILYGVHQIFQYANPCLLAPQTDIQRTEEMADHADITVMREIPVSSIHRIAYEISYKCIGGEDTHLVSLKLLTGLGKYSWGAKAAIALAAFTNIYGKFRLMRIHCKDPLAKSLALLEKLPVMIHHSDALKEKLEEIIKRILRVTHCIIKLQELSYEYNQDGSALDHNIPRAVYWTIRSVVACSFHFIGLMAMGTQYITTSKEVHELKRLNKTVSDLEDELAECFQHIEKKKLTEIRRLFDAPDPGKHSILKALIDPNDGKPMCKGGTGIRVSLEVLRGKMTLLLISNLDVSVMEEVTRLAQIYKWSLDAKRPFEVIWLPVTDRSVKQVDCAKHQLSHVYLVSLIPWYFIYDHRSIKPWVIKFIKEAWQFEEATLLVTLDVDGRVVHHNALHMMWLWGDLAFPFTLQYEEILWREQIWTLELMVDDTDPKLRHKVKDGIICLYGGGSMDCIRQFTSTMKRVVHEAVPLHMIYAGSNELHGLKRITTTITQENLSGCWSEEKIRSFWVRLYRMQRSILHHIGTVTKFPIFQEVMAMMNACCDNELWAVITSASSMKLLKSRGKKIVKCLSKLDAMKKKISHPTDFISTLEKEIGLVECNKHSEVTISLSMLSGKSQATILCKDCQLPMKIQTMFQCREYDLMIKH